MWSCAFLYSHSRVWVRWWHANTPAPFLWMHVCACAHVRVQTQTQLQESNQLFMSECHKSFRPLPRAHLHASVGQIRRENYRSPQHRKPGITPLHLCCCLCPHTHLKNNIFQLKPTLTGTLCWLFLQFQSHPILWPLKEFKVFLPKLYVVFRWEEKFLKKLIPTTVKMIMYICM